MVKNVYGEIRTLKEYALENKIPIMVDDGIDFLTTFIIKNQIDTVLEVGTAIGYSAIMMALASPNIKITTIEKDKDRYLEALKNVKRFELEDRITLIFNNALDTKIKDKFDLVFIDAAKGKNRDFFSFYEKNLNSNGYIITDNMDFHGYVNKEEKEISNRNIRGLVRKIKDYINFLENNVKYKTKFYKIGDGIAVSEKRI